MKKILIFFLFLSIALKGYSQSDWDTVKETLNLPKANNLATVKNYPFNKTLYISKDSLRHDIKITLVDTSYKIIYFRLFYDSEDGDIWEKLIWGNVIKEKEVEILKKLKSHEVLNLTNFKIEKKGNFYTIPEFYIFIID